MDPGHVTAQGVGLDHQGDDGVEVERGGVHHQGRALGRSTGLGDHRLGHERARIEHDRAAADEVQAADGDEVGGARAGTDEVDRHWTS
jgi:hypothetical protein